MLRSSGLLDVGSCFRRPQVSITANSYWLHAIDQVLWCSDQMHQLAEFELNSACNWHPLELLQCRCDVITHTEVEH